MRKDKQRFPASGGSLKVLLLGLTVFLALACVTWWRWMSRSAGAYRGTVRASVLTPEPKAPNEDVRSNGAVACLGHIEPQDGVLRISAAYVDGRPQRVSVLKVKQGERVSAGQTLAILDGYRQLETSVRVADARVGLARAKLAQVKAGATLSEIAAQKAEVEQLQAALGNARSEYRRYEALQKSTDVSVAELESRRLAVTTAERKLEQAQEHLKDISRVRTTDIDVAESELQVALAESEAAHAKLSSGMVRSPTAGQVLKILAYEGEEIGPGGLLDLGKTDAMFVEAEVYESDVAKVRLGQQATITSDLFAGKLSGVVEIVGTTLSKNDVLPLDPVAFADARVFKVWIRLNEGGKVSGLIHGKVNVVIQP